jgi:hypothetical protein
MRLDRLRLGFTPFAFAIVLTGCKPAVSHDQVARVWSPSGQLSATLFEENGGATTSFGYEVELGSKDGTQRKSVAQLYGAQRNEKAYGANLRWENSTTLVIECLNAKTPATIRSPVNLNGQNVIVISRTGIEDKEAPAGGMKFNLRKNAP